MSEIILSQIPISELEILIDNAVTRAVKRELPKHPAKEAGYITRPQACKMLHIGLTTLHSLINNGTLRSYHLQGRTLLKESEVLQAAKPVSFEISHK